METAELLTLWSDSALVSAAIWLVLIVAILYLARQPVQKALRALSVGLIRQARRLSRSGRRGADGARRRARHALLQLARESVERSLSRQIHRLGAAITRDLASFPHLHRQVHEQITRIDEDYRSTVEAPPTPPEWLHAIESVARLPARDDPAIGRMLEDMHATLDRACHESLLAYRAAGRRRHRVLKRMQPLWRRMDHSLETVRRTLARLESRTTRLDQRMEEYADVLSGRSSVVRRLAAGLGVRALLSCLVLLGIAAASVVGFHLIARPLAELGAGVGDVAGVPFNEVTTAVVLVLLALIGGLLLDTTRVTHLFPEMNWVDDRPRRIMAVAAGVLLIALLGAIAALAWTRDYLAALDIAADAFPADMESGFPYPAFHWIPAVTHSLLAIGLGLAVAVTALPLENLLRQGRVLALGTLALALRGLVLTCDLFALAVSSLAQVLARVYDIIIFLPLAIESWARDIRKQRGRSRYPRGDARPLEAERDRGGPPTGSR